MLVPLARLFRRQVPSRAAELDDIKAKLHAERATDERELALTVRAAKLALAAATGAVTSCTRCASGKPWPRGAYAGGDCCSSDTAGLFSEDEVAALAQAGTRVRDLEAPRGEHAGCAFRDATRCTLGVEHRPTPCVRYACDGLRRELHQLGRLDEVEGLADELARTFARFVAARSARSDREWVDELAQRCEQ